MEVGLVWYDDSQTDFAAKVLEAAQRYEEKFGAPPNRCYVNPTCLPEGGVSANGIKVVSSPTVLPNHFWVGVQQGKVSRKRQRTKVA